MRKIAYFIILMLFSYFLMSCNDIERQQSRSENNNAQSTTAHTTNIDSINSINNKLMAFDSINRNLIKEYDCLATTMHTVRLQMDSVKTQMAGVNTTIQELKSPNWLLISLVIVAIVMSLFALILSLLISKKMVEKNQVFQITKDHNEWKYYSSMVNNTNKSLVNLKNAVAAHGDEINRLNAIVSNFRRQNSNTPTISNAINRIPEKKETNIVCENWFARSFKGKYFNEVSKHREGCIFKIMQISSNEASFDIISIDSIRSFTNWKEAVDYDANQCKIEDATMYETIELGKCIKENDEWRLTQKLRIKIK